MLFSFFVVRVFVVVSGARFVKGTEDFVMLFNLWGVMGYMMFFDIKEIFLGVGSWKGC